jgi:hypothetical protein
VIDNGYYGDTDLSGLNLGLIMEIPGYMSRGNWTAGLFVDKRASIYATKAFTKIFHGEGWRNNLAAFHPGRELSSVCNRSRSAMRSRTRSESSRYPRSSTGSSRRYRARNHGEDTVISNSEYWIAPEIIVAKSERSKIARLSAATGILPAARPKSASPRLERPELKQQFRS